MSALIHLLSSTSWLHLMHVLLHTLWQGALVALGLWWVLRNLPAQRTEWRYGVSLGAFGGLVVAALLTWALLDLEAAARAKTSGAIGSALALRGTSAAAHDLAVARAQTLAPIEARVPAAAGLPAVAPVPKWVGWGALAWLAGCSVMSLRLLGQWVDLRRIRRFCVPISEHSVQEIANRLTRELGLKRAVFLATSKHISGPSVFGAFIPVLLLPPAVLAGIPVAQLEAILAHELSHIRRHDYLVNLLQEFLEALLFFNPAVWWISRQIRIEREACCDRLAVEATGQAMTYARSLTEWAEGQAANLALAPAFGGARNPGGPLDRLKRLLISGYRPVIRLPWYSFASLLVVSGALLLGLWQGAHLAVGLAAELLTPAERIQKITEIDKQYGQPKPLLGEAASKPGTHLKGSISAPDGSVLPHTTAVHVLCTRGAWSTGASVGVKNGRFECDIQPGRAHVEIFVPGFAPTFLGPFTLESGETVDLGQTIVTSGFDARLRVTDRDHKPLSGASIEMSYMHPASGFSRCTVNTGADGVAPLEHLVSQPMQLKATLSGYEYEVREGVRFERDGEEAWALTSAVPTRGTVVSPQGQPIPGAEIILLNRGGLYQDNWGEPDHAPRVTSTDAQGAFALTTLSRRCTHTFLVRAPGYAGEFLKEVTGGEADLKVVLGPELVVHGRLTGDLSRLPAELTLRVANSVQVSPHYRNGYTVGDFPLHVDGTNAAFTFTNPVAGTAALTVGKYHKQIEVTQPIPNLVWDLNADLANAAASEKSRRQIRLAIRVPEGMPLPEGDLHYEYWSDSNHETQYATAKLAAGCAQVTVPTPGGFSVPPHLAGYWFEPVHQSVAAGAEPIELILAAIPAGAIYGQVVNVDGSEASGTLVSVYEAQKSPLRRDGVLLGVSVKDTASSGDMPRFAAQPLPLGGSYVLVGWHGQTYVVSEPIRLTEAAPLREIQLKLPAGVTVRGQVLDSERKPIASAAVALTYSSPYSGFGSAPLLTDSDGWFTAEAVNPDAPGSYWIEIKDVAGFQPVKQQIYIGKRPLQIVLRKKTVE